MATVIRRGTKHPWEHAKTASHCAVLTVVGAVALALFGYVLFVCLRMEEHIHLHAPIQSIADIFRQH